MTASLIEQALLELCSGNTFIFPMYVNPSVYIPPFLVYFVYLVTVKN